MSNPQVVRRELSPFLERSGDQGPRPGKRWRVFAGIWLVFLLNPLTDVVKRTSGADTVLGVAMLVAFAGLYLLVLPYGFRLAHRTFALVTPWLLLVLGFAVLPLSGESGLICFVFVAVSFLSTYPRGVALAMLAVLVVTAWCLPYWVHGWSRDGAQQALSIVLAAAVVLSMFQLLRTNRALVAARQDLAEMAVLEERERFARDLHDILGHSLTVITKKAELARRLTSVDPERAGVEIADVERLAREALQDLRATVTGYREVTLSGELASAREALAAAGIVADLPRSVEQVPGQYRGLFGWAVREAVTNVLRHSAAHRCRISVSDRSLEVSDDGHGAGGTESGSAGGSAGGPGTGTGLVGLRERVVRAGGELRTASPEGGGFVVSVLMPGIGPGPAVGA